MDLSGEYRLPGEREAIWQALRDPEVLKAAIPGCTEFEKLSESEFTAKVTAKVGPIKATFTGMVTLADLTPPASYTIRGEGQGGVAGFAKGRAEVTLDEVPGGTVLRYNAEAMVGGKLAQIGSRVVRGTVRKLADQFFDNLAERLGGAKLEVPTEPAA